MQLQFNAIFALVNNNAPRADTKSAARLQTVGLDNLKLDSAGRLNPITYFTWKSNIKNLISKMNLDTSIVLQLLRTKNHLPDKIRESLQHTENLPGLFDRIEKQTPELGSAVTVVVKRIVGLRQCGSEGHAIELRCSELILAIQDLHNLFPTRKLTKSEALACLISLHSPTPQIMALAKTWSVVADAGGNSINSSLSEYIDKVREMYSETRYAVQMYGHDLSTKTQLNFKKSGDRAQTTSAPPKAKGQPPPKRKGATSPPASKAIECRVCKKKHVKFYHKCQLLKDIQHKKVKLPSTCYKNCLGRADATGKCTRGDNCHVYTFKKGDTYNLLCKIHKDSHFSICTLCPPRTAKSTFKDQIITVLGFRASSSLSKTNL